VGALGPVFRTYEPTRDRLVAVKVFRLDITPEQAQALADELALAAEAELFHPSIVEPIAAGVEGTVAYRAEEYVAAESLDVAMRHYAPASFDTMMRIVGQLAEAIDAARAAGVGHGALHPRDIFVTPDEARASGFGVVDALERVGLRAPVRRPYSAPERIAGADWTTPADIFSLGAIAFELLTARRPSGTGAEIGPLTGATVADADRIQAVLARAMDESPAGRFATGLALANALASAGASTALAAGPASSFSDDTAPPVIEMIAIPSEAPVFADEEAGGADEAAPGFQADADAEPHDRPVAEFAADEADDIAAERDEDVAHWALTTDEATAAEAAEAAGTPQPGEVAAYGAMDVEAAADALVFDAADLALSEERPEAGLGDTFSASRLDRDAHLRIGPDATAERPGDAGAPAFAATMFDRSGGAPPQIIERDVRAERGHFAEDRVPFEHMLASSERPRTAMMPLAMMLIVGVLIGSSAVYFSGARGQAPPAVPSNVGSPIPSAAGEPQGTPAGTLGTAADASDRPAPPPATPAVPRERPSKPAQAAPPPARSGTLIVRSTPPGAAVTINGKWSGRTPLTKNALAFGDYTVRVLLPGYQTRPEQVTLSADAASRTLSVQLQREVPRPATAPAAARPQVPTSAPASKPAPEASTAATGTLEVDSRPVGARVFVDDRPVGTTPVRLPEIAPGSHVVRMELADHRTWTEVAQVGRGKVTRVAGSLEPIR
jgi:Protein kinase domain/PEGA domain